MRFRCFFPVFREFDVGDAFAPDCAHHHSVPFSWPVSCRRELRGEFRRLAKPQIASGSPRLRIYSSRGGLEDELDRRHARLGSGPLRLFLRSHQSTFFQIVFLRNSPPSSSIATWPNSSLGPQRSWPLWLCLEQRSRSASICLIGKASVSKRLTPAIDSAYFDLLRPSGGSKRKGRID